MTVQELIQLLTSLPLEKKRDTVYIFDPVYGNRTSPSTILRFDTGVVIILGE